MNRLKLTLVVLPAVLAFGPLNGWAQVEFDETRVIIEINATDGDVGFHAKYDAGAWWHVTMFNPHFRRLLGETASGPLKRQGVTENFFESAEPLCIPDPEEPDELVVTLAQFLGRFPAGDYYLWGRNNEHEWMWGGAELTHDIPAAPDISSMLDEEEEPVAFEMGENVVLTWAPGTDLGGKCDDAQLIANGVIPDPAGVEVVAWEAVVEPDCEEDVDLALDEYGLELTFTAQLHADDTSVTVPAEFMGGYLEQGCYDFKFEVGAIEASGNQTFSEGEFEIEEGDD